VFVAEWEAGGIVRRIDAVTGIITRIAGGGTNVPGTGPATNMNLGEIRDLAVSDSGQLFIAGVNQVFQVDLATGQLSPFAGGTNAAFSVTAVLPSLPGSPASRA